MSKSVVRNLKKTRGRAWHLLLTLALLASTLFSPGTVLAASRSSEAPRVHPALLKMAKEHPGKTFRVIVQKKITEQFSQKDLEELTGSTSKGKTSANNLVELTGSKSKGKISMNNLVELKGSRIKELTVINGFAMELTGKQVQKLARMKGVRWISLDAPLVSTGTDVETVRDEFTAIAYNGNNGTQNWSGDWQEVNDDNRISAGQVRVTRCPSTLAGNCLACRGENSGISRSVDLNRVASAQLSFAWQRTLAYVGFTVEVRANGGKWYQLLQIPMGKDQNVHTESLAIPSAFLSANTEIRLMIGESEKIGKSSDSIGLYADNVQIEFDRPLSEFLQGTGAAPLRSKTGLTGQGVTVAVVDSGIATHVDLQNGQGNSRIVAAVKFGTLADTDDGNGHGTHVAGIVAANDPFQGMAPGVNLINVKVSNDQGQSYASDLVTSLQWILANKDVYNIRVVNISLNSTVPESYHTSPIDAAVEILWFNGITVVVAAGNNGSGNGPVTLYAPANDPFVITVGATEDQGTAALGDDSVAGFSAYGITEDGFAKPDLVAPGRNLISLLASPNATNGREHPLHMYKSRYFRMSGTSMAAPVVTGAVALLLQNQPTLTPDQVKYRLKATAKSNWPAYSASAAGAGILDIYAGVGGTSTEKANVGVAPSKMLFSGANPVAWDSVNWNSVNWNSVNWNSVNWNSVNWNSVNWNSALWDD